MGGIGDYIHWKAENYNATGINRRIKDEVTYFGNYNFEIQRNNIRTKINNSRTSLNSSELESIRKQIAYIFSNTQNDDGELSKYREDILQAARKEIDIESQNVKWATGNVQLTDITNKRGSAIRAIKSSNNDKNKRISTITRKINSIMGVIGQIKSKEKRDDILTKIGNIEKSLADILNLAESDVQAMLGQVNNKTFNKYFKSQGLSNDTIALKEQQIGSLISDLNDIVKKLTDVIPINQQKGKLFEYVFTGLQGLAQSEALDQTAVIMSEVIGNVEQDIIVNTKNMEENIANQIISLMNLKLQEGSQDVYVAAKKNGETAKSEQKIDVKITLNNKKQANISMKNANLRNDFFGIDLTSESPLYFMLQDQDSDFVNHYFNLVSATPSTDLDAGQIMSARQAVKMTVLWVAFSGDIYGRETADLFIVNDNTKTGIDSIYVIDLSSMVEKAIKNLEKLDEFCTIKLKITDGNSSGTSIDNLIFKNEYVSKEEGGAARRIANLLNAARNVKVSVALKKTAIKNYYKN